MKIIRILTATICLTALSLAAVAQEEEDEGPLAYTYASYFNCTGGSTSVVDAMIADDAERVNGLVEDGTISGWGWLEHHTGGNWDRIFYFQHESLDGLLDGLVALQNNNDDDEEEDAGPAFQEICSDHEDYIWAVQAGTVGVERGAAGFSVYHDCDITREERAGEIVEEHFAPILDGFVENGKLTSWGWSTHVVGGKYRALQTMTAADQKSLLAARNDAITAIYDEDSEAGTEFSEICGPHVDYMWNIQLESN